MSKVSDDDVIFDIRRTSRWLFDDDVRDLHLIMPISLIGMGIGLFFMLTIPAIWIAALGGVDNWFSLVLMAWVPIMILLLGGGLYRSEGKQKKYPRITSRSIQVPTYQFRFIGSTYVYETVPLRSLKDIRLESGFKGMNLAIDYLDDEGKEKTYELSYAMDEAGYEADIYGFMEALDKVHPDGPQPSAEEFRASLKDSGSGKKAPTNAYMRHEPEVMKAMTFPLLYFSLFMMTFFFPLMLSDVTEDLFLFILFVPIVIILFIVMAPILLDMMLAQKQAFLDELIKDFKIDGDEARIPTTLLARIVISRRPTIKLQEIKEVRLHLVQHPLSNLAAVEMADGSTFLVSDDVLYELEENPWFERRGRRLVNTSTPIESGGYVARVNWFSIRIILLAPLLFSIAMAIGKLATLF